MKRRTKLLLATLVLVAVLAGVAAAVLTPDPVGIPTPSVGKVERIEDFPSRFVTPRDVDVWLPPGYSAQRKYAVLYMQDGQMLFDASITWNKQEWRADETAAALMAAAKQAELLRMDRASNLKLFGGGIESNVYLRLLVQELKPYIDKHYSVLTDAADTAVMGSSMGALISLYAIAEYPQVFGAAA